MSYRDAGIIMGTLTKYWASKDPHPCPDHIPRLALPTNGSRGQQPLPSDAFILAMSRSAWDEMKKGHKRGRLQMEHAGIVKQFQLSRMDLSRVYDAIMLDEAQDSNDCTVDIVTTQTRFGVRVIMVGDKHQVRSEDF